MYVTININDKSDISVLGGYFVPPCLLCFGLKCVNAIHTMRMETTVFHRAQHHGRFLRAFQTTKKQQNHYWSENTVMDKTTNYVLWNVLMGNVTAKPCETLWTSTSQMSFWRLKQTLPLTWLQGSVALTASWAAHVEGETFLFFLLHCSPWHGNGEEIESGVTFWVGTTVNADWAEVWNRKQRETTCAGRRQGVPDEQSDVPFNVFSHPSSVFLCPLKVRIVLSFWAAVHSAYFNIANSGRSVCFCVCVGLSLSSPPVQSASVKQGDFTPWMRVPVKSEILSGSFDAP